MSNFTMDNNYEYDDLVFFNDMSINQEKDVTQFRSRVIIDDYVGAKKILTDNNIKNYYGAWILNAMSDGTYALQHYMKESGLKKKPELTSYKGVHSKQFKHWISTEEII